MVSPDSRAYRARRQAETPLIVLFRFPGPALAKCRAPHSCLGTEAPNEARLLLLYDRKDFLQGEWPPELREPVAEMTQRIEAGSRRWARVIFGKEGRDEIRLAQSLISELPVAVVRQHLLRGEPPPRLIDCIIRATYRAVLSDYRTRKARSRTPKS
jgi:hypothetical protein